jgi:hypothetical protein
MASHSARPAPRVSKGGPQTSDEDRPDRAIPLPESFEELKLQRGRLIDHFGHQHSEHIFANWSPQAIWALGIRRVPQ